MVTVWSNAAKKQLRKVYQYIYKDSPQNAAIVRDKIIDLSIQLCNNPEKNPPDKYKQLNDGSYRAFEIYHYRISYRIINDVIRIVRLRHTSRSPIRY